MWEGIFIFVERHLIAFELIYYSHLQGGRDVSGKRWQQPPEQATGIRAGTCLVHVCRPALISLVYEAMDDEPGLPVCLKIWCLNCWWIREENLWQMQKDYMVLLPSRSSSSLFLISAYANAANFQSLAQKPPLPWSAPWPFFPCPTSQVRNPCLYWVWIVARGLIFHKGLH